MELDVAWAGTLKAVLRGIVAVQEYEVQTIDVERSGSFSCGSSDSQTDKRRFSIFFTFKRPW
jgi:hypothetical protein